MNEFVDIGLKYFGLEGWVIVVILLFFLAVCFPLVIFLKMNKYKKEAMFGIMGKFHTATKNSYYAVCEVQGDFALIYDHRKLPMFARQKKGMKYAIDGNQVTRMPHPQGRPRFMQTLAPTLSWRENHPECTRVYTDEESQDTAVMIDQATDESFGRLLVGEVQRRDQDAAGPSAKKQSMVPVYLLLTVTMLISIATLMIVRNIS